MIFDRWSVVARARNRAESLQLKKQLDALEKQKCEEMVLLNNKKNIYKKKYMDLNSKFFEYKNELLTCETQAPKGMGDQKSFGSNISMVYVDYNSIHDLVFTKDAVDIEKLLILHLLSVHKSETLTPPRHKLATLLKETSPTARLVEKSRRPFFIDETIMDLLPFYTIEISELGPDGEKRRLLINRDSRLSNRILFNRNLRKLIITVLSVLHKSNFSKFKKLIQLAQDSESIKHILTQEKSREFIAAISEQELITSPENFTLTPPFKLKTRDLNIKTPSGSLEDLVRVLRATVLQIPIRTPIDSKGDFDVQTFSSASRRTLYNFSPRIDNLMSSNDDNKYSKGSLYVKVSKEVEDETENAEVKISRRTITPNFVQRNIKKAAKTKKIEYDSDEDLAVPGTRDLKRFTLDSVTRTRRNSGMRNFQNQSGSRVLENSVVEEHSESTNSSADMNEILKNLSNSPKVSMVGTETMLENADQCHEHDHPIDSSRDVDKENRNNQGKYSIKHTTCPACMEKWKMPLPTPKTPRLKNIPEMKKHMFKTDSKQKLELLINKELFVLESYDRRYTSNTYYKPMPAKRQEHVDPVGKVNINPICLAKIEQEIREKETHKKLEKFLNGMT